MPIEIKELVVKITIEESKNKVLFSEQEWNEMKKKIVNECVDKVIIKLETQMQR